MLLHVCDLIVSELKNQEFKFIFSFAANLDYETTHKTNQKSNGGIKDTA